MKISFLHYKFHEDGVTRVVLNNIKGLKHIDNNLKFSLIGSEFSSSLPKHVECSLIDWNSNNVVSEIKKQTINSDVLIIENPTIGIYPKLTKAFKDFSEKEKIKIIYRTHDFVEDRPYLKEDYFKIFENIESAYPRTKNVKFACLTENDCGRLKRMNLDDVLHLPNPLQIDEKTNSEEFKSVLLNDKVIEKDEKIISYAVRIFPRKNIEEAMLITKLLEENYPKKIKLIVTLPFDKGYFKKLESFRKKFKINCSLGEVSKYLRYKDSNFTVNDLYKSSEFVITTSILEGFGYAFLEPWVSDSHLFGRDLESITRDFKKNGLVLDGLYDYKTPEDIDSRIGLYSQILKDNVKKKDFIDEIKLYDLIKKDVDVIQKNKELIKKNYDHRVIGLKLYDIINS